MRRCHWKSKVTVLIFHSFRYSPHTMFILRYLSFFVYFLLMLCHSILIQYDYIEAYMYLCTQNIQNTICFHVWKTSRCILTSSTFHGNPIKAWSIPIFSPSKPFLVSNFTVEKKNPNFPSQTEPPTAVEGNCFHGFHQLSFSCF